MKKIQYGLVSEELIPSSEVDGILVDGQFTPTPKPVRIPPTVYPWYYRLIPTEKIMNIYLKNKK